MKTTVKTRQGFFGLLIAGVAFVAPMVGWANAPVTTADHQAFERKFAEMCIAKEKADLKGSGVLLSEVTTVCECIAREESQRVTAEEVKEFVGQGKYPASLMMKSNAATYTCVQAKN